MKSPYLLPAAREAALSAPEAGREVPPPFHTQPPWRQLRQIRETQRRLNLSGGVFPTVELCGDRAYLRALRAAELTAWESDPSTNTSRLIRRQLGVG